MNNLARTSVSASSHDDRTIGPAHLISNWHEEREIEVLLVSEPVLGREEVAAVAQVIEEGWITLGPRVEAFEKAFAARHGAVDAVAVDSCTAALHLALEALGIGPGDEVLAPSLTFVATINAIHYTGAEPVLVDIKSLDDPLMSVEKAAARVTSRTRAVMLMHYAGHPADRDAWREFANRHGLLLIEDAAHAVGIPDVGSYGDAAAFSFYGNKNMTTAEGGMILMRDPVLLERARRMRAHGMTSNAHQRLRARSSQYDVISPGWNYRMDEMRAALGLVQLSRLAALNARRAELAALYRKRFGPLQKRGVLGIPFSRGGISAHHIFPVVLPEETDRAEVMAAMSAQGVQTTIHYSPVHELSYYRSRWPDLKLTVTEEFARREMTLPLHAKMADSDVDLVAATLEAALSQVSGVTA